jgi:heme/copper-type cytochrome/quinol oxidase subunit 2
MCGNRLAAAQRKEIMARLAKTLLLVAIGLSISGFAWSAPVAGAPAPGANSPAAAVSITLYGSFSAPAGWGWAATNITNPGPTLTVHQGDVITFHLFSHDAMTHLLVIDLDNSMTQNTGDQASASFTSGTVATNFTFTAATAGTFNYFCGIHPFTAMHGSLVVQSTGGGGGTTGGMDVNLLIGGVVIVVAIVAVVAAIVMRRKKP